MVRRYLNKANSILEWGKVLLPHSSLRFYPPSFTLRDPVSEGVTAAIQSGKEVVVIVYNLQNFIDVAAELTQIQHHQLIKQIKKQFRLAVLKELNEQDIIMLHDQYGEGITLYLKVDYDRYRLSDIDQLVKNLALIVEQGLQTEYPSVPLTIETGYMFIEKNHYTIQDMVAKAHRQAIAMAEKRLATKYDNMIYNIKKIISKKNIRLMAQPIIDVETKEIWAWEILTRGPKGTSLENPLTLFSVARQTGTLYELEMLVIEKAIEQIKGNKNKSNFFVNCTPITLGNIRFTRDLENLMRKYGGRISPKQITFEVTENDSITGLKNFSYNIKKLRLMGYKIAVDDTGSGYSNLSTISEIMPDVIKIDRSVIQNIDKNSLKESMLKGLMLVAREAGSLVVAEGIENEDEALVLTRNNVDLAQGYFYAPPTLLMNEIAN
ncbi:EAL domain-containing protein [Neobacillus sp. LXY-1]|uniref:EAL domain-containing protein n=1 Tax=Neobacillus sp. LXY-1 TaxID=3379133 RepID=UPI003EDF8463